MGKRRVVVLGGTGFVGSHVVARLVSAGCDVVVPTRRRERARHLILLPTVNVVEADIHDAATLGRLAIHADAVINLVGILHESGRETFARDHVELARIVVDGCKAASVSRLLQMSALGADPDGRSRYQRSKGEAERIVRESGLEWTIFRPSVIFGRGDSFLNLFAKLLRVLPVVPLGGAGAKFQPVFVGDVAECFVRALSDDRTIGQCYELGGPKVYTLRELVAWVGEITGNVRPIVPLGAGLASLQALVLEHLPGRMMTRDNLASMSRDNVVGGPFPAVFGIVPASLEAVGPTYLSPDAIRSRYDDFRAQNGR